MYKFQPGEAVQVVSSEELKKLPYVVPKMFQYAETIQTVRSVTVSGCTIRLEGIEWSWGPESLIPVENLNCNIDQNDIENLFEE